MFLCSFQQRAAESEVSDLRDKRLEDTTDRLTTVCGAVTKSRVHGDTILKFLQHNF